MVHPHPHDRSAGARPETRTVLIARELSRRSIDNADLSEPRLAKERSISEPGGGYTFFWKGKAETKARVSGVGLVVKTPLFRLLPDLSVGISERLLKLRIPLSPTSHATIISTYAPILTCFNDTKEPF